MEFNEETLRKLDKTFTNIIYIVVAFVILVIGSGIIKGVTQ